MRVSLYTVADQKKALETLVAITEPDTIDPLVRNTALAIVHDCTDKDDECEIDAVYEAVKHGTPNVPFLMHGLKYVADPRWADFFTAPSRTLKQLQAGINGGDCDDHSSLVAALLGSLGFITGFRVWGPNKGEFTHVYPLVAFPKNNWEELVALDTTVAEAAPGWEPEGGYAATMLMDGT